MNHPAGLQRPGAGAALQGGHEGELVRPQPAGLDRVEEGDDLPRSRVRADGVGTEHCVEVEEVRGGDASEDDAGIGEVERGGGGQELADRERGEGQAGREDEGVELAEVEKPGAGRQQREEGGEGSPPPRPGGGVPR